MAIQQALFMVPGLPPVVASFSALPDATSGDAYSGDVNATGGNGSFTFTLDAAPGWMSINSSTGALTGTPSGGDAGTGITVTARATDGLGNFDTVTDTIDVVAGWTPDELFALGERGAWWDWTDLSTMWQDSAGTIPVTAVGQNVVRINDKSGNNAFIYAPDAARYPVLAHDGSNYCVDFDGIDDYYGWFNTSIFGIGTDDLNIVAGAKFDSTAGYQTICSKSIAAGLAGRYWLATENTGKIQVAYERSSGTVVNADVAIDTATHVFGATIDRQVNNSITVRKDGVGTTGTYSAETFTNNPAVPFHVGAYLAYDGVTRTSFFNGRMYGLIIWFAPVDAGKTTSAESWMAGKCGVML